MIHKLFLAINNVNHSPPTNIKPPRYISESGSNIDLGVNCSASDPDEVSIVELFIDAHFVDALTTAP